MVEAVLIDAVTTPQQRRYHSHIGHITGGKQQRPGPSGEIRQFFLQRVMFGLMAAHQMGSPAAHPIALRRVLKGMDDLGLIGEPQVIITPEGQILASVALNHRARGTVHHSPRAVQMGFTEPI